MTNFNRYIKQVKRHLKCPSHHKKEIINCLTFCMEDFLDGEADLPLDELNKRFGNPKEAAANYLEEVPEQILRKHRRNTLFVKLLSCVLSFMLLFTVYLIYINSPKGDVIETEPVLVTDPPTSQAF